jgi:hypothetical protein
MKTLDELITKVDSIADSQGKLLAALNAVADALFCEKCKGKPDRNKTCCMNMELGLLDAKLIATGNGLADEMGKLCQAVTQLVNGNTAVVKKQTEWIDVWNKFVAIKPPKRAAKRRKR